MRCLPAGEPNDTNDLVDVVDHTLDDDGCVLVLGLLEKLCQRRLAFCLAIERWRRRSAGLGVTRRQVGVDVDLGNPEGSTHAHRWKFAGLDQPVNGHRRNSHQCGDLLNRQEARLTQPIGHAELPTPARCGPYGKPSRELLSIGGRVETETAPVM